MVRNRIKVLLAEAEITATTLVEKMPAGVDKVAMSYITNGRVLPTRESLETMCDVFSCTPADIYEPREIDLLSVRRQAAQAVQSDGCPKTAETDEKQDDGMADVVMQPSPRKDSNTKNEGMEQFRVWLPAEEKAALFKAIAGLGYHSAAERGGFLTARKIGRQWFIDENEPYSDLRVKSGRYIGRRRPQRANKD